MGLFKSLDEKPYTKADYYNEMEARHAAKIAAKAPPVVVVPVREPEWLEPETITSEQAEPVIEEVVIPYVEPVVATPIQEEIAITETPIEPAKEKKSEKISKQKRKKTG